jgi:glyoxylase-like metal-dependent hydrolase (beta-lactamase superfamily II)
VAGGNLAENAGKIKCPRLTKSPDMQNGISFETFTGGPLDTNAYLMRAPGGVVLFDAPQGADAHFAGDRIDWLVLTHGHFDHVMDAAAIARRHARHDGRQGDPVPPLLRIANRCSASSAGSSHSP